MTTSAQHPLVARAGNGVVTPLYFDRQVVRAEDLSLDRLSHDAELARMRRLLHGWGVVMGLVPAVVEGADGPGLTVTAGYGVTPSGEEVFLHAPVVVDADPGELVRSCCGPGGPGCELPPSTPPEVDGDAAAEPVTAWLVARPVQSPSDLRAGVPAGCEHPASALLPTRACHAVSLELECSLPELHQPLTPDCAAVSRLLWGGPNGSPEPVDLPLPVEHAHDYLVLARVVAHAEGVTVDLGARRRLLPLSVLQQWVVSCAPQMWIARPPRPRDPGDPEQPDDPAPPAVVGPRGPLVVGFHPVADPRPTWDELRERLRETGFVEAADGATGGPRVPRILTDRAGVRALERAGVRGPREFLDVDPAMLAEVTGLDTAALVDAQAGLRALTPFFGLRTS